ncbi:DNA cytosine methyltransferase [Leyella stercorea]|uniref:DNA cytosine methyltransferase n=1 Tax=Leyella stercorea TaxID=363265 RepID=UPI00242D0FFF|nr:DNA cytosine methyltransferase [Leyella stercorea]
MFDEQDRQYFYNEFKNNGYEVGSYDDFKKDLNNKEDRDWYYNEAKNMGYDVGTQADFDKMVLEPAASASPSTGGKQVVASAHASTETKPQVAQPVAKPKTEYPQEVLDAYNSPDNKPGNFKDLAQLNDEYQRGVLNKPGIISQALGMMPKVDAGNIGKEQKVGGMIANMLLGDNMQQPQQTQQPQDNNQQVQQPAQQEASPESKEETPVTAPTSVVNNEGLMDAKLANYLENWKQRPDKQGTYFENMVADLLADGTANSNEEAVNMVQSALGRYANRSAMDVTNQVVASLPDDTVQDAEKSIEAQWYSHGVQDKLKQEADSMGISYDDYVAQFLKPAMVQSLVNKYGPNYRDIAEGIATRLYSHDEHVQDRLMNQDINKAFSDVISKYVSPSVVDEYNKAQEAGSKAFTEGMEGSQFIPANLRLGTALGAQYEANEAKDPAKVLSSLQKKFGKLYRNPEFLNDMSNAAFKVMQRYGLNGDMSGDPKQFKPMINSVLKNELDQLEIKGMMPKGSAEYIMKTGLGNTIVGKITRKAVQTDYQNWLEDMANQQYQPGFWENVASGALTFAGDAWSYWLPGAAGGKVTKSMLAKAEGRLASDLMAKGMEAKMAERAAKVLIGKSKGMALKTGAAHGAVTFGGQSAISKPIDEIYRTGQFDENGKVYNPSVGKILANTLGEVVKQSAVGAIMQGGTIANMVGKGRGLATNILADVGGKVVDSSIMTGQQMLERMAHDPNFKPTGKDAAESFLESMANLTSIGLPGMVGKYARFKDAKEFNRKFDFNDQDIAELKRFGYDDLRDAFEKLGINGYRADGEGVQMMGQLTDKYMNLMNDKGVPEVLKAKMMAVVEGKRPSSFSPVIDSIIVQPMDNDGKVYLETLNKDGGIIDRKGYSSLEEAQKAEKKLDFEKSLNITSEYEKAYHTDALQDRLNTVYEQARDKYAEGEQLSDEDKAAIYLHQNASAIGDIMQKQQSGMELTEQEQQMVNSYRHFYDSAFENSPIMKEYVRTFEDSQGVEHGTLRKALEGDGKSRTAEQQKLVEEYQKQLYNDIVLKREMNDAKEQMSQTLIEGQRELPGATQEGGASAQNAEATAEKPLDASVSSDVPPTEPLTPPVGGETPINAEGTPSVENGSSPSDATTASNESKSDAYIMGQNAYQKGDAEGLKAIDHNDDVSKARLKRAFGGDEAQMNVVVKAYEDGKDMEQFVAQRANSLTPAQQDAVHKYVEAQDAKNGVYDALQHADDGYGEALKEQLWPYQTEDGNIVPATLTTGQQVFLKKANEYGGGFVVVPGEDGNPTIKQVSSADIKEVGTPVPMDDYINQQFADQKNARQQQFFAQYDGSGLKPSDTVEVAMESGDEPMQMTFAGYSEDGKIVLSDGKDNIALTKDEFNAWRQNALDASIGAELDAEDAQRANDDAAKAEADKKQRYANGIVGLSEGQPDYSSKDTEPKVAAEYLQEQYGEDHGKLLNLVNGSRDDIKTQLANKKKAAAEYQDWLDTNADLDPEKAKKVEDELSLVNEQIADLDARFKNWNTIRNSVMTPDEVKAMKEERKAEVEKAGVDETAIVPSDDFHVLVLDDKELKKQYPTMDEANDYITSQRKDIYHTQEDVEHKMNDVNDMLEQYINGETELDPTQLMELNTTKAQLEALQTNLSVAAKGLKAQANKLSKLYKTEVSQQEMEELGMTPSEQRKTLVADALKKNDLGAIKEIYKDASVDVTDLTPQTLEDAVSESLRPHSLNPESLQYELGKSNFKFGIGKGYDSNKFNYLIAKKGTGMSVNDFAVKVYNDLPVNLQDMGYTDQDVRNALLDMFKSYDSVKEMRNVALMNRIAAAEDELSSEEEYYEAQKEREIIERQAEIENYKSYINEKELSLPSESELDHIYGLEYDRMMEIEDRDREYKQFVKSILPELADYDDRSNEEGYGGGSSLGSDSSRRGVDEGNSQGEEVGNGEASSESEIGEGSDSGRKGRQETGSLEPGEGSAVRGSHLPQETSFGERLKSAIAETETEPTEAQKKAGNYKKGHLSFGGYDYTVETPKGVTRSGKDEQGKPWSVTMHDTYGYILGKIGVDGDHIDMFINDAADLDTFDGNVYVVDQVNPETGEFDEHKVMYGYPSEEAATEAYLANYSKGWKGLGKVTAVPKATFDKWLESSDRKTKPFADYAMIKKGAHQNFISDMEYTYENDVHPSEEDKPKMQKFAERLLDFHQDREDKPEYGYTMLSSNINGDKLYPSEKKWFGTKKYRQGVSWVDNDNVCAYELNPRFNARGYLTAVGVHKLVPLATFHRDVKEVKPSEMTEAQKVAYDAVSTMLKKAGIPVKVVSNEDMEKVAEAQDNLNLAMLLNHPEMRFKIKTPEEKKAAENAYNFAKELRPDKWKQYAVVDMNNPNKMPEYFEKQELARKERSYYNKLMWGNYKVFNLDKSFEDNVAGLTGSFPSEFDPYKIDAQTNKRNELKKQIKETEEAYKLTGQERKEYQNQLMKEYMDEHGLASENDIPDDVWREFDYKAVEKYQDKLDSLFAKYKDLDRQLKAVAEPGVQYLKGKGVVYGYTDGKEIVLNQEHLNANTPIHEYQHLWRTAAKKMNPELIAHGDELIKQTQLFRDLKEDPNYKHLSDDEICDEAFARLTGEDGAAILEQMAKDAIKENPLDTAKELTIINRLKNWLKKFWYWALDTFTKWKPEDIKKMTLEDIRNLVLRDLANGVDPRTKLHEAENADDIKFMGSTTKKRMKNIASQFEGRKLDEAQQAVADVYSGKDNNRDFSFTSDGSERTMVMRQGNDDHAGTKHSVYRHFGVNKNYITIDDILSLPKMLNDSTRKPSKKGTIEYSYTDKDSGVTYTVVTKPVGNKEHFQNFYSDRKVNPSDASHVAEGNTYTPEGARKTDGNAFTAAKVDNNSETAKGNGGNLSLEDKIKAVSQQFGVDEADVAMYANAIKKGSTAEAARARANIKRHLMQVNEGNIFSFKDIVKYTVPVNNALKENFGDLDAMIEERVKQVEAQRNAMEAARKRAEEEEAKRQKHLEELSLIPDDQLDKQYMDALAKGDDATAREMLDEAARRKGYDDTESSYQGVGAWAAPGNPGYESDKARRDDWESSGSDVNLEDMALGYTPQPDDYFSHPERYSQNTPHGLESVKAINTAIDAIKNGEKDVKVKVYHAVPTSVKEGKLRNGDWVTPSKKYAEMHGTNRLEGKYRIIEDEVPATQLWWDGNDANEFGFDDGKEYKYKNAKNNRKLNDLVTYDDEGDVIPPSKRLNSRKQDVRFHRVTEPEELERLNKEKTFRMYSGMQELDGKLYSPMAAIIDGKRTDATEIGAWMGADERPDLVKGGKFQLVKTDKNPGAGEGPVRAAYNPYMHTSTSMMNDQFTGAYARGNIKVVEWEIPESEKTSGYHAEGAKDAVGLVPWHSGSVNGLLPKDRQRSVMLSRWRKAVRVVPDSEVAESIAKQLDGTGLAIPWNVVTPNQLRELVKLGVPITTEESGQQAPATKEKFLAQMDELKKEFPQAQFVDVKMTKEAFKEWGGKGIVKSPIVEQKLQKHPDSLMKAGTYFSGGGLVEEGLKGIIDPVVAVEYDRKISGVYRNNFGQHIVTADVRDVDPKELVKHIDGEVEYFHASPVCKNYSQAKSNGGEVELDKETAKSTADFIDAVKPRVVTIENVKGYKDSEAMKIITQALDKNGYKWDADVYNAADFGGYTSRERLIVRAVKDGELPEKPKKQPRKGGWLEAVEDILPTLTEKKSGVAPWMDARLKVDGIDWQKVEKPLYVMGSAYADGKIPHAFGDEILPTLRTKSGDVIIMPGGKVLRADGRVLARITGLGDDYLLPKTESLAHTIIGNGIPVQLTKGVIAPLLNKDDLSGRNVLARLGSSIFKNNWDADKQKQVSDQVVNTANKLGGAEATVYTSVDEVPDAYLSDVKNGATGWYDPTTHTVHVYLPNCADANEAERTVLHEKIGHEGMEVLLGGENEVRKFANFVYRSVGKDVRGKIIDFANKYDPDWKNNDRMNVGTQEYIAHLAEEGPKTAEDFTLWTKIKHYLIKVLKKLGVRVPGLLNDKDLRYYLMKAGKALHVWDEMPQEKQEAMMKQASNAEIKDALGDGAGKGKPRQKKGESAIQYMKRVMEWKRWKEAREDENDPEPPMFYDFDKDAEGKKEWERLNKEWRDSHHLQGDEIPIKPERKEGETDEAFFTRYKEWEKWNDAMADKENPMPDMFSFEKQKQDEARQKYEDWLTRHELNEQNDADLDLYEGKVYPAETNPEADALEQRVMQDLAEVTSTDVSKEGAAKTVKHAVIHRRKNMEEASADDAIYINDVKNRIEKMADSGAFDKLLSDYKGKPNRAEKLAEAIPYIIEAPRRLRDLAHDLNATGAFDKGHIHIQPDDVEAIQPFVADLIAETAKKHTVLKDDKEVEVYDDPLAVGEVASKMAQAINANHQGEEAFVPIDGSDIMSEHVLPLVMQQIVPEGIDYKNLSPEMKATLDSIRDWYNYTYDWLKDNRTLREDTGYNADYVNHIWDKEKSDKQAYALYVENRQRTKSPNEKPRTISTLMEGISVGLVPKTTDITKMMAYYSRSNIEAWVNKTMLQELSGLNVIERNEDGEIISSDPLLSSTPPFNLEQYQYFEIPGVGPVWVYNVSPKQVKVKNPITGKEKVLYSEASAGDRFGVVFETYQSSPFWKAFDTLASSAKKLELGFSGFHAGALTEVYMVQNMVEFGPKKAMANFMKYIFADTMKNHELPCFANPQDFQEAASHLVKFGATNDYAAADVQNMFDNMRDAMMKVQEKLKDGNGISGTVALATMPLKVATQMLSLINKGMDRALWDFLHDGLKLATYRMRADKTKERAKKKGWTEEELSRALDEDGQFVNDMFGGQHWDILGASHRTLRYAGRVLLSPDWNASTTRHFLALTGYGSIWNEATFENFKHYYKRLGHGILTPEDEGRRSRQISSLLCYGIGFMVFYEAIANGINAAFRAMDEEKERKKAEEIRKTNPSYKSMYELAYGDEGMKWYDYLMRGNSLGQQSKIFMGRYADGTEMYIRHGKQFREVPEYLFNHKGELEFPGPMVQRMIGKANPMVRMTLDDINYLSDFQASHADQEIQRKYGKTIGLLYKDALYWAPFLIPSQENKEFKAVDFFFPSSKGFSPWKAQSYFKDFILSGDMEGVVMTYQSCQRNGIDPEAQIKAAIGSVKALESAEMSDGVTSLQEASQRFDAAKSITEKKKMRQKMKKFLSQSDYKAFTQKEALDMVQGYLNGDEDLKEMEKAESKYLMAAKAEDVTEDWRIQNVWNGTMETYQEYQRLKDVDKAKANAFKNSKTNKRLFAARKAISAAKKKMNKAKKQMDGQNDAAKLVEIRKTRKELLETLNGME